MKKPFYIYFFSLKRKQEAVVFAAASSLLFIIMFDTRLLRALHSRNLQKHS